MGLKCLLVGIAMISVGLSWNGGPAGLIFAGIAVALISAVFLFENSYPDDKF